jgi:hypothetical protein
MKRGDGVEDLPKLPRIPVAHWNPMSAASVFASVYRNKNTPVRIAESAIIQRRPSLVSTQNPAATGPSTPTADTMQYTMYVWLSDEFAE